MTEPDEHRLRQDEALLLLTNRVLMDFISLQVDAGRMTVEEAKALVRFSATEVKRGAQNLEGEVDFFADVLSGRFAETPYVKR